MSPPSPPCFPRFKELPTEFQTYIFEIAADAYDSRHCTSYHIDWSGCEASDPDCKDRDCKESISEFTDYGNHLSGNTYIHGFSKIFVSLYNGESLYYSSRSLKPLVRTCWLARWIALKQWKKVVDIVTFEEVPAEIAWPGWDEVLMQKLENDIKDAQRRAEGDERAPYPWSPQRRRESWESW